jgi:hypothetical protein
LVALLALLAAGEGRAQVASALRSERAYVRLADEVTRRDLERDLRDRRAELQSTQDYEVDLNPVLDNVRGYLGALSIPLHEDRGLAGSHGIAFSAAFRPDRTLPPVRFHIGNCGPFDAFYGDGGFRWAFSWPLPTRHPLSLYLQGGEDNEFGKWALTGFRKRATFRDPDDRWLTEGQGQRLRARASLRERRLLVRERSVLLDLLTGRVCEALAGAIMNICAFPLKAPAISSCSSTFT